MCTCQTAHLVLQAAWQGHVVRTKPPAAGEATGGAGQDDTAGELPSSRAFPHTRRSSPQATAFLLDGFVITVRSRGQWDDSGHVPNV